MNTLANVSETTEAVYTFLLELALNAADEKGQRWINEKVAAFSDPAKAMSGSFYMAFSGVPRFTGHQDLRITASDSERAASLRPGFDLRGWSLPQAVRTVFLLCLPQNDEAQYVERVEKLFATAVMEELVALYGALPVLAFPEAWKLRAAEGVRTNMTVVFDAVTQHNPYPADYFDENAWNQMVLKALFVDRPLYRISGLDKRANPGLARILSDYAHERWAAGRKVSPELWRSVGPFLNESLMPDIERLFGSADAAEQEAGALACAASQFAPAKTLLAGRPGLEAAIAAGELSWDQLADRHWEGRS